MLNYLRRLQDERDSLTQTATQITETAVAEGRDLNETEQASIAGMSSRCAVIDGQLTTYASQLDSQRNYAELRARLHTDEAAEPETRLQARAGGVPDNRPGPPPRAWGELLIESAQFRGYDGHGSSGRVEVPGIFTRAAITLDTVWGNALQPTRYIPVQPSITTPLLDAAGHITTANNSVTWFSMPGAYPLAGIVAEGDLKPEADFVPTENTGALQTYAHWKAISRQTMEDMPQMESIVSTQLEGGIYSKLEVDLTAAMAAAPLQSVPGDGANGLLGGIRVALGHIQAAGFPGPKSVVLNPMDWADLDLDVMRATNGGPNTQANFWGLTPIAANTVPAGTAYVGDLKTATTIYDRGSAAVFLTDSHADYFIRNLLVVMAETRALCTVEQPAALIKVEVPAAPPLRS